MHIMQSISSGIDDEQAALAGTGIPGIIFLPSSGFNLHLLRRLKRGLQLQQIARFHLHFILAKNYWIYLIIKDFSILGKLLHFLILTSSINCDPEKCLFFICAYSFRLRVRKLLHDFLWR